ncbi:Autophagy-related protein 16 [Ophiocordyceps camponoti-floridani]|uniref:Autophagy-related protein 16 n=1 Tax=Ophiocordyceps camponoti-floridani TaxID=2030778 RepID=A0A8H4Q2F4_9HYPO|nr:Autophagy-related protein 16 [Ophiocordyceps camponoti-floridani]
MSDWRSEYLASIKDVERQNPVNMELVQACSQMADYISALEADKASVESRAAKPSSSGSRPSKSTPTTTTTASSRSQPGDAAQPSSEDSIAVAQLRLDLAETLRSKGATETRLRAAEAELGKLRSQAKTDGRAIKELSADRTALTLRVKDREHELREKRKLLEQVQDEMITLNLQVSMAEKERDKVTKENKELVDRWMRRMAQEADAMNLANEPHFG